MTQCDYNHESLAATSILKRCPGCDAPLKTPVDIHSYDVVPGSKTLSPLVTECRECKKDCCNCKQCNQAKGGIFNLCMACIRKIAKEAKEKMVSDAS